MCYSIYIYKYLTYIHMLEKLTIWGMYNFFKNLVLRVIVNIIKDIGNTFSNIFIPYICHISITF